MLRIAAIVSGSNLSNRRGVMNAALNRIELLDKYEDIEVTVFFLITSYERLTIKSLLKREIICNPDKLDGRQIQVLHKIEYFTDCRLFRKALKIYHRLTGRRICDWKWHRQFVGWFKGFDAISAHFNDAIFIADSVNARYGIPFFASWHGSDIHTTPFNDQEAKLLTIHSIEHAACNFYVSNALLKTSDLLTEKGKKLVLHNGVGEMFKVYDAQKIRELRTELGLEGEKVVTFAGNLIPIKNAVLLPDIFKLIQETYEGEVKFWVIGDGDLGDEIQRLMDQYSLNYRMWGNQPYLRMPDFFNCTDVLVLPSKNEGLPLVTVEAIACGANVIGSNVGGITESIGDEFTVPISETFVVDFATRVVELLNEPTNQGNLSSFCWAHTVQKEYEVIKSVCK